MGRVIHFEIHAEETDRAEAFYTGLFGWTAERYGGPVDYRVMTTGPDGSIEDTERAVPEAGGEQVLDRMEVPGVGRLSYFKDTEGNIFGALEPVSE